MTHHKKHQPDLLKPDAGRSRVRRQPRRMSFAVAAIAASLPMATLAGCAGYSKDRFVVGSVSENYKTRHPIILGEEEQTLDIPLSKGMVDLPRASAGAVTGFANAFIKSASGVITIMLPSGSPNAVSARHVGSRIAEVIRTAGVPGNRISTVTYHAQEHGASAPIRLSYGAVRASVEGCGKWPTDLSRNSENKNFHNFGCASQNNLAAIISNPADLLGPRGMTGVDPARRSNEIRDYRESGGGTELEIPASVFDGG